MSYTNQAVKALVQEALDSTARGEFSDMTINEMYDEAMRQVDEETALLFDKIVAEDDFDTEEMAAEKRDFIQSLTDEA